MAFIVPFMYKDKFRPNEKPHLVYSVNEDDPEHVGGWVQGYWKCTHCGEWSKFRFYDDAPNHQAICPKCRKEFIAIEETEENE